MDVCRNRRTNISALENAMMMANGGSGHNSDEPSTVEEEEDDEVCNEDTTVVMTCEGHITDPQLRDKLQALMLQLKDLTHSGRVLEVLDVKPWNSVRVTFSIPLEAARRLSQLAQAGEPALRQLGILSIQVEGDQVVSLRLAGLSSEASEITLRAVDGPVSAHTGLVERFLTPAGPHHQVVQQLRSPHPAFSYAQHVQPLHGAAIAVRGSSAPQQPVVHYRTTYQQPPPPPPYAEHQQPLAGVVQTSQAFVVQQSSDSYRLTAPVASGTAQVLVRPAQPVTAQPASAQPSVVTPVGSVVKNSPLLVGLLQQPDQQPKALAGQELGLASSHLTNLAANHFTANNHTVHQRQIINPSVNHYSSSTRSKDGLTTHQQVYSGGSVITNSRIPVAGGLQQHPQATGKPPPLISGSVISQVPVTAIPQAGVVAVSRQQANFTQPLQTVQTVVTAAGVMQQAAVLPQRAVTTSLASSPSPAMSPAAAQNPTTVLPSAPSSVYQVVSSAPVFTNSHVSALTPPLTPSNQQIGVTAADSSSYNTQVDNHSNTTSTSANDHKVKAASPKASVSKESQYLINPNTGLLEPRHNYDSSDSESDTPPQPQQSNGQPSTTGLTLKPPIETSAVKSLVEQRASGASLGEDSVESVVTAECERPVDSVASTCVSSNKESVDVQRVLLAKEDSATNWDKTGSRVLRPAGASELRLKLKLGRDGVAQKTTLSPPLFVKKNDKKEEEQRVPKLHIKIGSAQTVIVKPTEDKFRKMNEKSREERKRNRNRKRSRVSDCEGDLLKLRASGDSQVLKIAELKKAKFDYDADEGTSYKSKDIGESRNKNLKSIRARLKLKTPIRKIGGSGICNLGELTSHKILETLPPSITKVAAMHTQQPHRNPSSASSSNFFSSSLDSGNLLDRDVLFDTVTSTSSTVTSNPSTGLASVAGLKSSSLLMNGDLSHAERGALTRSLQSSTFSELTAAGKITIRRKLPEPRAATQQTRALTASSTLAMLKKDVAGDSKRTLGSGGLSCIPTYLNSSVLINKVSSSTSSGGSSAYLRLHDSDRGRASTSSSQKSGELLKNALCANFPSLTANSDITIQSVRKKDVLQGRLAQVRALPAKADNRAGRVTCIDVTDRKAVEEAVKFSRSSSSSNSDSQQKIVDKLERWSCSTKTTSSSSHCSSSVIPTSNSSNNLTTRLQPESTNYFPASIRVESKDWTAAAEQSKSEGQDQKSLVNNFSNSTCSNSNNSLVTSNCDNKVSVAKSSDVAQEQSPGNDQSGSVRSSSGVCSNSGSSVVCSTSSSSISGVCSSSGSGSSNSVSCSIASVSNTVSCSSSSSNSSGVCSSISSGMVCSSSSIAVSSSAVCSTSSSSSGCNTSGSTTGCTVSSSGGCSGSACFNRNCKSTCEVSESPGSTPQGEHGSNQGGEDSGIESMDALSEKSPNLNEQSPNRDKDVDSCHATADALKTAGVDTANKLTGSISNTVDETVQSAQLDENVSSLSQSKPSPLAASHCVDSVHSSASLSCPVSLPSITQFSKEPPKTASSMTGSKLAADLNGSVRRHLPAAASDCLLPEPRTVELQKREDVYEYDIDKESLDNVSSQNITKDRDSRSNCVDCFNMDECSRASVEISSSSVSDTSVQFSKSVTEASVGLPSCSLNNSKAGASASSNCPAAVQCAGAPPDRSVTCSAETDNNVDSDDHSVKEVDASSHPKNLFSKDPIKKCPVSTGCPNIAIGTGTTLVISSGVSSESLTAVNSPSTSAAQVVAGQPTAMILLAPTAGSNAPVSSGKVVTFKTSYAAGGSVAAPPVGKAFRLVSLPDNMSVNPASSPVKTQLVTLKPATRQGPVLGSQGALLTPKLEPSVLLSQQTKVEVLSSSYHPTKVETALLATPAQSAKNDAAVVSGPQSVVIDEGPPSLLKAQLLAPHTVANNFVTTNGESDNLDFVGFSTSSIYTFQPNKSRISPENSSKLGELLSPLEDEPKPLRLQPPLYTYGSNKDRKKDLDPDSGEERGKPSESNAKDEIILSDALLGSEKPSVKCVVGLDPLSIEIPPVSAEMSDDKRPLRSTRQSARLASPKVSELSPRAADTKSPLLGSMQLVSGVTALITNSGRLLTAGGSVTVSSLSGAPVLPSTRAATKRRKECVEEQQADAPAKVLRKKPCNARIKDSDVPSKYLGSNQSSDEEMDETVEGAEGLGAGSVVVVGVASCLSEDSGRRTRQLGGQSLPDEEFKTRYQRGVSGRRSRELNESPLETLRPATRQSEVEVLRPVARPNTPTRRPTVLLTKNVLKAPVVSAENFEIAAAADDGQDADSENRTRECVAETETDRARAVVSNAASTTRNVMTTIPTAATRSLAVGTGRQEEAVSADSFIGLSKEMRETRTGVLPGKVRGSLSATALISITSDGSRAFSSSPANINNNNNNNNNNTTTKPEEHEHSTGVVTGVATLDNRRKTRSALAVPEEPASKRRRVSKDK